MFTDPFFIQLSKRKKKYIYIYIYIYNKPNICNNRLAYKEYKAILIKL